MENFRNRAFASAIALALTAGSAAQAQQAGVYSGTSADGENVSFIVGTDYNTGKLAVLGATVSFNAECKGSTNPVDTTWGFGFTHDIENGKASFAYSDVYYFYIDANFVFKGSSVTGEITSRSVALVPSDTPPKKSAFCLSPKQAFAATLSSGDAKTPMLPAGAAIHYSSAR